MIDNVLQRESHGDIGVHSDWYAAVTASGMELMRMRMRMRMERWKWREEKSLCGLLIGRRKGEVAQFTQSGAPILRQFYAYETRLHVGSEGRFTNQINPD